MAKVQQQVHCIFFSVSEHSELLRSPLVNQRVNTMVLVCPTHKEMIHHF